MSICLCREVSGHFLKNPSNKWSEIWHDFIIVPTDEVKRGHSVGQHIYHPYTKFQVLVSVCQAIHPSVQRSFQAFPGECMEGMAWNLTCDCILTTFGTDYVFIMACQFSWFGHNFGLTKWEEYCVYTIIMLTIIERTSHKHSMMMSHARKSDNIF